MANEVMFPLKECPSFERVLEIIVDGFHSLSLSTQQLTIGVSAKKGLDLSDKLIYIKEHQYGYFCWVSFSYFEPQARDEDDMDSPVIAGVSTRGANELKFSIIIAYVLAKSLEAKVIYDDAYLVQKKEIYPPDELVIFVEKYIKELFSLSC
ncbi:hypothetical protein SOASR030_22480 [Leminorella grimontii]|uniref:Uncharacterized protein n=1 Tax=Leminorella grimontii TaxID=82981 RepID=A0AAV5N1Y8_9GAMM|nr:hypothetical protein [Leminorella grimontii]KFC96629.1 hypothetical protein GLGR_0991 [Leminorella grimontii ATCC 33999 = DSM 5078]GKX56136.1 hypothetical protein SOASR030_22480 [Leminorella grimontii]VFS57951.1 Uncharacterised protein [Leminorella grimontii]